MKKHKFSEELPEVGKMIVAKISNCFGVFIVEKLKNTINTLAIEAEDSFIDGEDVKCLEFNITKNAKNPLFDWWAYLDEVEE